MRKLKVKCKRIISILLVAALLMGSLSPYVYAADVTGHVTGAADVMLEGDAYDLPGVEEDLTSGGAEVSDELDALDTTEPLTDDEVASFDNAATPYDEDSQKIVNENSETINEDTILEESAGVLQPVYSDGSILIYSYQQLLLLGSGEPVHVGDAVPDEIGTGDVVTDAEGSPVYYAKDGVYSLACDIPLNSEDFWQIPEGFEGRIVPLGATEEKPLYNPETDTISIYNTKQLASLVIEDAGLYPVMSGDADAETFGMGQLIYPEGEEEGDHFLTYSSDHNYILSAAFTTGIPVAKKMLRGPVRAVDDPLGGRDFKGQVLKEISGITYILIGNKEQLQKIGSEDEVYTRVYEARKVGSGPSASYVKVQDSDGNDIILYGGDADLQESDGYGPFLFHGINDRSLGSDIYYAGQSQTGDGTQLGDGDKTKGIGGKSWQTGKYYTTDAHYIIFRDIDLNNKTWNPLMFTGTMYGAVSSTPETAGSLWESFSAAPDGKPNELNVVDGTRKPVISNINVEPATTNRGPLDYTQVLDIKKQKGVGFFGTIQAEFARSGVLGDTAIVKNLELRNGSVNNLLTEGDKDWTLIDGLLRVLAPLLDIFVEELLKGLTGKNDVTVPGGLTNILTTRKDIPSYLATGAFAGRILGDSIVEDCVVSNISVNTVQTKHEEDTTSGRKIVGKGGFVGYVEGETQYDGLSNAVAGATTALENVLNIIPGLGLGDLITLLLENALPLKDLIPIGYTTPEIRSCEVDHGTLSVEPGKYGVGGFAGSVSGAIIKDSKVVNSEMTVNADHFGGGFAGVARDAIISGTLSGLRIEVLSTIHPQTELIKCSIENSSMTVNGGSYLGGFTGVLANSYAFNDTIDKNSETTVTGTGDFVGGFTGSAELGTLLGLGDYLSREPGVLDELTGIVGGLLSDSSSKSLLHLGGVAPAAIMGCYIDGRLTVTSGGSYVGGIAGRGEGTYITCSSPANIRKLAPYARQRNDEYVRDLPIAPSEKRPNRVMQLVSVGAGGNFAGGIAGYLTTASAGGVLDNAVGLADYIPFYVWQTTIQGVEGGYTVTAGGNYAGGGIGWAVGGDIKDVNLHVLKSVEANNRAGGFVGATGPGDLVNGGGVQLKLLGINVVELDNILSLAKGVRTTYARANVTGIESGFTVKEIGEGSDATIYSAGGFAAEANSVTMKECHVTNLLSVIAVDDNGVAGGFVGISSAGGLAGIAEDTTDPTTVGKLKNFTALQVGQLVQAIPYLVPYYDGCTVSYVKGGFVQADTAGGFAGDFQSGKVNTETWDPDSSTSVEYEGASENCMEQSFSYENGLPGQPYSVFNIHHVRGGHYAGGWGGKVYSGALVSSGGGLSILGGSTGAVLNVDQLLGVAKVYVPVIKYAGVNSYHEDTNEGFSVYAHAEDTIDDEQTARGYAGGFIGYGSGIQVSYSDVHRLKTGDVEEPDPLEGQDGSSYMTFTNTPNDIPYAVAGARYAGGYIGHMDVGSAASVGDSLKLLGSNVDLTELLSAFSVVVSTIEYSHVYGAEGGFSVIASGEIDEASGDYDANGIAYAGGYAGKISGGHIQTSNVDNFYYIVGEIAAGGYVGEMVPGDVANILDDSSNVDILKGLLGTDILNTDNFASLVQDFVPTIRNSQTSSVPCGGAVRAQCFSDELTVRGMAGGYVGHSVGGQVWGNSYDTWKSENDGYNDLLDEYIYLPNTNPPELDRRVGRYTGTKHECSAIRIRSVYGAEYAGGYCGLMECGSTAQTGGLELLGGLIDTNNLLGALQAVYPVIRCAAVYGPLEKLDVKTWNSWVEYVGSKGGFAPELYALGELPEGTDMDAVLSRFIYGYHVVAGRDRYDSNTTTILGGCAGGFVGSMHSGVIRHGHAHDAKLVRAMRAAGGFAGEMQTKGLAELGSVSLLGIDLQLGNLLEAGSVFVPAVYSSGTTGYKKGLTVEATGDSSKEEGVGCAGGFVGAAYGGQIGDDLEDAEKDALKYGVVPTNMYIRNLKTVKGTLAIGGFAGKTAAASVLSADTGDVSQSYLNDLLRFVNSNPSRLITLLNASISTIKRAEVSAVDADWGFVVDGEYTDGDETKYADYAGGFVGHMEATVIGERKDPTDIPIVNDLRGVSGGYYAGGFFGLATTGGVAEVGGNNGAGTKTKLLQLIQLGNVSVLDAFRSYVYHASVNGVDDGIRIYAHNESSTGRHNTYRLSGAAGGFGGGLMNGTVENSQVTDLNYIEAPNYAAGFIGHMGKGGLVSADEISIDQEDRDLVTRLISALGLDLNATAQVLNVVGSTVESCQAAGFAPGFITQTTSAQRPVLNVVNEADLIGSCSAGFTGFGDISQIKDCQVANYKYAVGPQIAAGFIGRTSVAYLAGIDAGSPLVQLVVRILDVLVKALYLDNLEEIDLINAGGNMLGLKVLADGDLLYVNLFGLKIGVSLSKQDSDYEDNSDAVIITLGSSTIKLPCDENGIKDTDDTPNVVINLIQTNRTAVKESTVTGIGVGYDIFAGGSDRDQAGTDSLGYAGGFVGYNDLGYFSNDRMRLCDEVCGTPGKVGSFTGQTKDDNNYSPDYLEGADHNNVYSIYREEESSLTTVVTASNPQVFGEVQLDNSTGVSYNRYDVLHREIIKTHADLDGAKEKGGSNERDLNAYVTAAKADLMLATPLTPNSESETVMPDELKDPCDEYVDLHIHKKWRDYGNLLGSRPESIEVEVLAIDVGTNPRWQLVQSIFPESDWTVINDKLGVEEIADQTITITGNRDKDGTIHWSYDIEDLPVAYQVTVMEENDDGELVPKVKTDNDGNPVYEVQLDKYGKPLLDEDGNPVLMQQKDDQGNLIFEQQKDDNGDPVVVPVYIPVYVTEVHYIQYVVTEKPVENYKVPQYEILEDTASVIITNELDGIILPGTGADGIYKLLMLGLAIFTLGAFLFLRRYRQMRNSAV